MSDTELGSIGARALDVLRQQFEATRRHAPGAHEGADPEEVHDMRVAIRRLRAALRSFDDVLPEGWESVRSELKWLGGSLSAVRDLDVQLAQLGTWKASLPSPDQAAMDGLLALLTEQRQQAREALVRSLDSARYAALMQDADTLLDASLPAAAAEPLAHWAPRLIERGYRKLRKRGDRLDSQSRAEDLHRLRIEAKRLRYLVEFVGEAYNPASRRLVRRVTQLQDVLGAHQDAQVASAALRGLLADRRGTLEPELVWVMGEIAGRYSETAADMRKEFSKAYRGVAGKRWRRLRKAMQAPLTPPASSTRVSLTELVEANPNGGVG
jgi:CHAD domain-containing protein